MRSVGISFLPRISQIYTDTYGALFSHRIHRIHRIWQRGYAAGMPYPPTSMRIRVICGRIHSTRGSVYSVHSVGASSPLIRLVQQRQLHPQGWQRGYGRDAIPSYICEHPCHPWESFLCNRFCEFRAFCGNIFPPTDFTDLHRYLGCAVLPQNSQNTQNLAAWVWQGCHTLLHLCASVSSVGGSTLPEVSVSSVRSVGISFLPRISQIYTDT